MKKLQSLKANNTTTIAITMQANNTKWQQIIRLSLMSALGSLLLMASACSSSNKAMKYKNKISSAKHGTPIVPGNFDSELLSLLVNQNINDKRIDEGLTLLQADELLYNASTDQNHYMMMNGKAVNEQDNDGKTDVRARVEFYGGEYSKIGENVQFMGFKTIKRKRCTVILYPTYEEAAEQIAENWIGSQPHYTALMNKGYYRVGTSVSLDPERNGLYASQVFGSNPNP